MQFADLPAQAISVPGLADYYQQSRLQLSRFWIGDFQISGLNLYGWPTSPTWPGARTLTENMLQSVSQEFIIGMQDLRYVAGDFNHPESLPSIQGWLQAGWVKIQTLHHQRSGYVPQDTYRGMSRPDRLYISPELAAFFTAAHYEAWFADHGALHGVFQLPDNHPSYWAWPLPAQLPCQLWHVVRTFRRMLLKQAALLDMWHQFQASFDGHFYAGPFSVLIRQLNAVSWTIEAPPYLTDHDGLQHNILTIDHHYLRSILEDAWRQRVALDASTRTDLQGLQGVNWPACRHLSAHHTALQSAQICALREGAFYLNTHKAKYDCFISATCARCLQPDTVDHRCLHCPGFSTSRAAHPEALALWEGTPISLRERLLPPRNPHHGQLRRYLHSLHERPVTFEILGDRAQDTHVFSDGTCTSPTYSPLSLAAWSVISASRQSRIASGPLPGEAQSSNRAELYAALITAQWTKRCRCEG